MLKYTLVSLHAETQQVIVDIVEAPNPVAAARNLRDGHLLVSLFEGAHQDLSPAVAEILGVPPEDAYFPVPLPGGA